MTCPVCGGEWWEHFVMNEKVYWCEEQGGSRE